MIFSENKLYFINNTKKYPNYMDIIFDQNKYKKNSNISVVIFDKSEFIKVEENNPLNISQYIPYEKDPYITLSQLRRKNCQVIVLKGLPNIIEKDLLNIIQEFIFIGHSIILIDCEFNKEIVEKNNLIGFFVDLEKEMPEFNMYKNIKNF